MAWLGEHYSTGDSLTFSAQTKSSTGTPTDADSLPTYQIYEQVGTTALLSGSFAKRDDANTTGFYEATVTLSAANGFEVGKTYEIRKLATVSSQSGIAVDRFGITNAGATAFASLSGWPTLADVQARLSDAGITAPADDSILAAINACVAAWERVTDFRPFLSTALDETRYFTPRGGRILSFEGGVIATPTSLTLGGTYSDTGVYEGGTVAVVNRDFTLLSENALARGKPYTHARVSRYWTGLLCFTEWASVKVVAKFGYAATIPADAWEAAMRCVLSLLLPSAGIAVSGGGGSRVKQGPVEVEYTTDSLLGQSIGYFEKYEAGVLLGYKMERMNFS